MSVDAPHALHAVDEDAVLRAIVEGTATETGERFFAALVQNLARTLHTHGAWVTEYLPEARRLRAIAFWLGGEWIDDYEYDIVGTPCEPVVLETRCVHVPDNVIELYPGDPDLRPVGAVSYMGMPLLDVEGRVLGNLAVLDTRPMPEQPRLYALFRIFAARASAELQRLRAEAAVRERERKLGRLVDSALDAIVELDRDWRITRTNPAAENVFGCAAQDAVGTDFTRFLTDESRARLRRLAREVDALPEGHRYLWVPDGFSATTADGTPFPAEGSLSRFELDRNVFYTLILRNVNDRLEAERRIRSLSVETEYLREELKAAGNFDRIAGSSRPLLRLLHELDQVADTDSTVLVLGETGTGKELVAHAIHAAGRRSKGPLVKVNCAAVPANLIESEFFGHEAGAFTGATKRREGRFALADGGTIFLDEVGELPLDLQPKLLRVLQEGEFEPVGSARTRRVDVRVIAATNRELEAEVRAGRFREDLYYRLNVFPVRVPPLRERREDIPLLASAFAERFARRMGRQIEPLSPECLGRLRAYDWPGNVRELQNVIERAVITSRDGRLDLARALPEAAPAPRVETESYEGTNGERVLTAAELRALEVRNLVRALEAADWQVAGSRGAAALLGLKPSTLSSRIKALGIERPRP